MKPANPSILKINGGSLSIKFALFEVGDSLRRILGRIERIGLPDPVLRVKGLNQADNFSRLVAAADHTVAVGGLMDWTEERIGRVGLNAVGHLAVHGGPKYSDPQLITEPCVRKPVWYPSSSLRCSWTASIPWSCAARYLKSTR